jgi:hypothetical protein
MRKLLIAILLMPLLVYAAETPSQCDDVQEVARLVMEARQLGAPLAEIYSEDVPEIMRVIVLSAWHERVYSTETGQAMAIGTFADAWKAQCIKEVGV